MSLVCFVKVPHDLSGLPLRMNVFRHVVPILISTTSIVLSLDTFTSRLGPVLPKSSVSPDWGAPCVVGDQGNYR